MAEKEMILVFESTGDGSHYRRSLEDLRERHGGFHIRSSTLNNGRIRVYMTRLCPNTLAVRKDLEILAQRLNRSPEWTAARFVIP